MILTALMYRSYFDELLVAVVTKVADETAAEEAEKVLRRGPVRHELARRLRQLHDEVVRVDGVSAEDGVAIADSLQDLLPHLLPVLDLFAQNI